MKKIDSRNFKGKNSIEFNNIKIIYKNKFAYYFMKSYFNSKYLLSPPKLCLHNLSSFLSDNFVIISSLHSRQMEEVSLHLSKAGPILELQINPFSSSTSGMLTGGLLSLLPLF